MSENLGHGYPGSRFPETRKLAKTNYCKTPILNGHLPDASGQLTVSSLTSKKVLWLLSRINVDMDVDALMSAPDLKLEAPDLGRFRNAHFVLRTRCNGGRIISDSFATVS
jgi:hypothetical protein